MKRRFRAAVLLLVLTVLLTTVVFADSGPKPQMAVRVVHAPQEAYYLDLLDEGTYTGAYETDETGLDPALLQAFRAAIPSGWHGCISQGSTRAPIWGDLTGQAGENGEMLHTFRYVGVPQTYRILMVTQSGEVFLSDVLQRDTLQSIVHKASGTSDEVQEEDTTRWADQTSDPLIIQGIADSSAKFATATADGCLYAVFNGIWSRQTSYFTVPSGTLSIMGCGTAEGTQRFKVAVWKKVDGGAEYVTDSTYYIHTDGTDYRCTISGLDPAAQYRVTISYDSSKYYLYGLLKVEGIG